MYWRFLGFLTLLVMTLSNLLADGPAAKPAVFVAKSVPMEFVKIPAGEFEMGLVPANMFEAAVKDLDSRSRANAFVEVPPLVKTKIAKALYVSKYEVTIKQFREFVKAQKYVTDAERDGMGGTGRIGPANFASSGFGQRNDFRWDNYGFPVGEDFPVANVSWNDARAFCAWLSKVEGRRFRLLTETEWEYACRAGSTGAYYFDGGMDKLTLHANVGDAALTDAMPLFENPHSGDDGAAFTVKVGSYKPNAWGLFDMYGNVGEWCEDEYRVTWSDDPQIKQFAQAIGGDGPNPRVIRGGHWFSRQRAVSSVVRPSTPAKKCTCMVGFRVALED